MVNRKPGVHHGWRAITANVLLLLQELTAAGRVQVRTILCNEPLSFPVTDRSSIMPGHSGTSFYRKVPYMKYSHVLVMDVGTHPVQLTAHVNAYSGSNFYPDTCPFNCSGQLNPSSDGCLLGDGCNCSPKPAGMNLLLLPPQPVTGGEGGLMIHASLPAASA
jgi:hypothetical protein